MLEATSNAKHIHDLLEPLAARVVVVNPYLVKLIAALFVKTDKLDALALARQVLHPLSYYSSSTPDAHCNGR